MRVDLFSVPHTGTHFVQSLLKRYGVETDLRHYGDGVIPRNEVIVSPLRDPWMCWVTHYSRGRTLDQFYEAWIEFNRYAQNPNVYLLPLDTNNRETYLANLSKRLNKRLSTNWIPVSGGERKKPDEIDLSEVYNLDIVKMFYEPKYQDYRKGQTVIESDPVIKRLQMGFSHETIKKIFGLSEKELQGKLGNAEGPKKRGRPKKTKG